MSMAKRGWIAWGCSLPFMVGTYVTHGSTQDMLAGGNGILDAVAAVCFGISLRRTAKGWR
jgi:hypothetical protein